MTTPRRTPNAPIEGLHPHHDDRRRGGEADGPELELSVVIPAFNEELRIAEQLDALLEQTWDGTWEIVVVDNGSTDATFALVDGYSRNHEQVRVLRAAEQRGLNYARNS